MKPEEAIEVLSNELIVITDMIGYCRDFEKESDLALAYRVKRQDAYKIAITALKEIQRYREIGTVEECREAVEKLTKAEKTLSSILSGNYNDECNFCVHNNNPMANCQCISGDGSWCIHNAKWNGKISDNDNLDGMDNGT